MKKLTFLSILLGIAVLFTNCEEEDSVKVDFEIIVTGESPNAIVQLTNTSDEADLFEWQFGEGASLETSTEANPQIVVDKAGEFTIKLTATTGESEKTKTKKVNITGFNGIYKYEDIELGTNHYNDSIGNFFSCETGLTYIEEDLNSYIGEKIDFVILSNNYITFFSPANYLREVPNGKVVRFNNNTDNSFTVADYDSMQDDQLLLSLEIATEPIVEVYFNELPKVILMRNEDGRWGAIKVKEVYTEKIIVDVKKQKYLNE